MNRRAFLKALAVVPFAPAVLRGFEFPADAAPVPEPTPEPLPVVPPGTISAFVGSAAPAGWLPCDGRKIDRREYPELAAVLGDAYGGRLPNLWANAAVAATGSHTHSIAETATASSSHRHSIMVEHPSYGYLIKT